MLKPMKIDYTFLLLSFESFVLFLITVFFFPFFSLKSHMLEAKNVHAKFCLNRMHFLCNFFLWVFFCLFQCFFFVFVFFIFRLKIFFWFLFFIFIFVYSKPSARAICNSKCELKSKQYGIQFVFIQKHVYPKWLIWIDRKMRHN